jgi:hypothetical protein
MYGSKYDDSIQMEPKISNENEVRSKEFRRRDGM